LEDDDIVGSMLRPLSADY